MYINKDFVCFYREAIFYAQTNKPKVLKYTSFINYFIYHTFLSFELIFQFASAIKILT